MNNTPGCYSTWGQWFIAVRPSRYERVHVKEVELFTSKQHITAMNETLIPENEMREHPKEKFRNRRAEKQK